MLTCTVAISSRVRPALSVCVLEGERVVGDDEVPAEECGEDQL